MNIFKRIFQGTKPATYPEMDLVEPGDRFYQIGMGQTAWVVERLYKSSICEIPHAVITKSGTFPQTKILSVMALLDTIVFRRDKREPGVQNKTDHQRRRSDFLRKN